MLFTVLLAKLTFPSQVPQVVESVAGISARSEILAIIFFNTTHPLRKQSFVKRQQLLELRNLGLFGPECGKVLLLHASRISRKSMCVWAASCTSCLFTEHLIYLKEQLTDGLSLFKAECSADILSTMNKVSLSLQGKHPALLSANDKMWTFKWESEFGGDSYLPVRAWQLPNNGRLFWWASGINKCNVFTLYNETCQHLEDLHNSLNQYFPNKQCMMLQIYMLINIHSKCILEQWIQNLLEQQIWI